MLMGAIGTLLRGAREAKHSGMDAAQWSGWIPACSSSSRSSPRSRHWPSSSRFSPSRGSGQRGSSRATLASPERAAARRVRANGLARRNRRRIGLERGRESPCRGDLHLPAAGVVSPGAVSMGWCPTSRSVPPGRPAMSTSGAMVANAEPASLIAARGGQGRLESDSTAPADTRRGVRLSGGSSELGL